MIAHPSGDACRNGSRESVGNLPERTLLNLPAYGVGDILRARIPPWMHLEMVAGRDGAEIQTSLIRVPVQHNPPAVESGFDAATGCIKKHDSVASNGSAARCLSPDRPG